MNSKSKKDEEKTKKDSTVSERFSGLRIPVIMYEEFKKSLQTSSYDSTNTSDQIRNLLISWLQSELQLHHYCMLMNYAVLAKTGKYFLSLPTPEFIKSYRPRANKPDSETDFINISLVLKDKLLTDLDQRIANDPHGSQSPTNVIRTLMQNYLYNKDLLSLSGYLMLSEYAVNIHKKLFVDLTSISQEHKI